VAVHFGMMRAFGRAGAAECDRVRKLSFEQLAVPRLVGARHDVADCVAHCGAVEVEADAGDQVRDVAFGEASVGASRAGLDAVETGVNTAAHRLGVCRLLRMRPEHGADGDGGHGTFSCSPPRSLKEPAHAGLVPGETGSIAGTRWEPA
jgi:hypothetical protein